MSPMVLIPTKKVLWKDLFGKFTQLETLNHCLEKDWFIFKLKKLKPDKTLTKKENPTFLQGFDNLCGRYWIRTSDPLLVRQVL